MKKKFLAAALMCAIMAASVLSTAFAAPTAKNKNNNQPIQSAEPVQEEGQPTAEAAQEPETPQTSQSPQVPQTSEAVYMEDDSLTPPDVQYAASALLMDMNSGRLIYGKNIDERMYPASTTKIMTGIIALEMGNPEDVIAASYEAIKPITLEDSSIGILVGEELTFEQLVTALLVHSANDAANVLAVHLGGSLQGFADMMNNKAAELGMTNTHFVNPCGTHDDNHYTTARDLAILSQYAMQNEKFRELVKTSTYKIPPTNKYSSERILVNTNLFLSTIRSLQHYYPPCIGIKTGHTSQSGYCLVSAAEYNGTRFLSIVMKCPNENDNEKAYSYIDSKTLFDFGFDNYVNQIVASPGDIVSDSKVKEAKNDTRVAMTVENEVNALVPSNVDRAGEIITSTNISDDLCAPIRKGDILGYVTYTYKGTQIGTANLIATNDVERNEILHIFNLIIKIIISPLFFIPVIVIILIMIIVNNKKKKCERQRRIKQLKNQKRATPDRNASRVQRVSEETKGDNSRYTK